MIEVIENRALYADEAFPSRHEFRLPPIDSKATMLSRVGEFWGNHKRKIAAGVTAATLILSLVGCESDHRTKAKNHRSTPIELDADERWLPQREDINSYYDVTGVIVDKDDGISTTVTCVENKTLAKAPLGSSPASLARDVLNNQTFAAAPLVINGLDNPKADATWSVDGQTSQVYQLIRLDDLSLDRYAALLARSVLDQNGQVEPRAGEPYVVPQMCFFEQVASPGQ